MDDRPVSQSGELSFPQQFWAAVRRRLRRPVRNQARSAGGVPSVVLSPRALRLLALLVLANGLILAALALALYRAGVALSARPPVVTVVVTPTPLPNPSAGPTPTPFGSGGAVAFTLRRNGNADIYAIQQTTREIVRLTSDPAEDRDPAWSPDGSLLAFASRRGGNWDIYLLDLEGGALIRLTRYPGFDGGPTWSPDGEQIAFESYREDNLDIYVMDADGNNVRRLTTDPAPDYSPAWSPDGSAVAFVSYRNGNQDIFLYFIDGDLAGTEINVTNSPDVNESDPAWSPDGKRLAYTIARAGYATVQVSTLEWAARGGPQAQPMLRLSSTDLFGSGSTPTWAPDGQSLLTVYRRAGRSYLIASSLYGWGLSQEIYSDPGLISRPVWSTVPLSARAIARARAAEPAAEPSIYTEFVQSSSPTGTLQSLVYLPDPSGKQYDWLRLNDRVDDSFQALRRRVAEEAGWDYLSTVALAWQPMENAEQRNNWHLCGRAVDLDQSPYDETPPRVLLVREDVGNETYWRVYLRAARQDGSLGEPLRVPPWDLKARDEDARAAAQGGRPLEKIPAGYYVDLTALAADYGWERAPALYRWRYFWPDINWWHLQKTEGIDWWQCMLEVYEPEKVQAVFGPLPGGLAALAEQNPGTLAQGGPFEIGGHVWNLDLPYADKMRYAGMTWVKAQVRYPQETAPVIGAAHRRGFKILIGTVGPAGMVTQQGFEENFARWAARLAAAGADAIEVWNEPNVDREWQPGYISPEAYTRLLCATYDAVKAANPNTLVIAAAPAPTGAFDQCTPTGCDDRMFLQGIYAAGGADCMDYLGVHYNFGATSPSAVSGHPADDGRHHHSWYFLPQMQLYYNIFGGTKQLFYTELGYASQEGVPTFPDHLWWARETTNAQQAAWLAEAVQLARESGLVRGIIIWNVDFLRYFDDPQDGFAIIRPGGACPACSALHTVMAARP
ncbi:MAG: PD40 domain-containing protein [Thermoflexales bacterium]|nr:PD40 domain-containing protein [Thermoflexales bacterium]